MLGIGCDLCRVDRLRHALEKQGFLRRVFTPAEQAYIAGRGAQSATGLWAAKEACAKALGSGFRGFGFKDIQILPDALGKPEVTLLGGAKERLEAIGGQRLLVTITHEKELAMAFAVAE